MDVCNNDLLMYLYTATYTYIDSGTGWTSKCLCNYSEIMFQGWRTKGGKRGHAPLTFYNFFKDIYTHAN